MRIIRPNPVTTTCGLPSLARRKILKRIEENIRGIGDPDSAMPDGDSRRNIEAIDDGGDLVELAVALGALQQLDAILARPGGMRGYSITLGDPDAAPLIKRHRHRIDDIRLGGDEFDMKAGRHLHFLHGFARSQSRSRLRTLGMGNRLVLGRLALHPPS